MTRQVIKIDPVTRVEGHLKIKVETDEYNKVKTAYAAGNLFRDFENILKGRDPWDAVHITQRICGVCPVSHAIASTQAIEKAIGFTPNDQALLIRAVITGAYFISDHILHFYHLNLMDYIKGPSASPWTPGYNADLRLGSSETEGLINNYLEALKVRRLAQEMVAALGGRMPHVMTIAPGGVTAAPGHEQIHKLKHCLTIVTDFVKNKYLPDVELIAKVYDDYFKIGRGPGNFITYSGFELPGGKKLFKEGHMVGKAAKSFDPGKISEYVKYSYYSSGTDLHPSAGETLPSFGKEGSYSWLKSPRYEEKVCETGPLARMKINGFYKGGVSVMDRIVARAKETELIADAMPEWINALVPDANTYEDVSIPEAGASAGLTEAPRGALGHWMEFSNKKITRYQIVSPTCWNASPKDDKGKPGAMEQALVGTSVKDTDQPVELLRIVHSFDPCIGCAVHVITPNSPVETTFLVNG